jgi:hypothetical protein
MTGPERQAAAAAARAFRKAWVGHCGQEPLP